MGIHLNLEKHCNEAVSWINDIADRVGYPKRPEWALNILKAVITTIRDRTTVQEVSHLSAQLPILIRGFYFEGYNPSGKPLKLNAESFMREITNRMGPSITVSTEDAFAAVLGVLYDKTSAGELEDIRLSMPKSLQKLWEEHAPGITAR